MSKISCVHKIFFLVLVLTSAVFSQRLLKLSVSINGETKYVPYIIHNGTVFSSAKEIASILSGNFYFSPESSKLELKFRNYTLKVTGRNQFIILTHRETGNNHIYQIPISTRMVKDDVYIPLKYCLLYINLAAEKELIFDNDKKHLTVTDNTINTLEFITNPPSVKEPVVTQKQPDAPSTPITSKYDVYDLEILERSNGTLIRIKSQKKINKFRSSVSGDLLYLFLSGVTIKPDLTKNIKSAGLVKNVEKRQVSGNFQLEFTLKPGFAAHETFQDITSNDILITIHNEKYKTPVSDPSVIKEKWSFDTIVIDAGHGGKDPGAIGVTGVREKDINLSIALKLGNLIKQKMSGVNVAYTRNDDTFVELYKRGKIANEAGGKLFISIHCNSIAQKPSASNGFEVYLLRPGRTKEAIAIAEFENSVIQYEDDPDRYEKLTDENFILVSMAHSAYMRYSEKFSELLDSDWRKSVKITSRGVKQAGFYVLVGASMPSVLIEAGFLSNKSDESYLNSVRGQNEIAASVFNSLVQYKNYYEESMKDEE